MDDMPSDEEGEEAVFDKEFLMHKRHYYITKMGYDEMTRYDQNQLAKPLI